MTEPITGKGPLEDAGEDELLASPYSKDYWDIVFEQLGKRWLFKLALTILVLLYASAIYAPFLANDRPFVLEAVNFDEYDQALKGLYPVTLGLRGRVKETPAEYLEKRTEGSDQSYDEALAAERKAFGDRVDTLLAFLPAERHGVLQEALGEADRAVELARAGDQSAAGEVAGALKDRVKELRTELAARRPVEAQVEAGTGADGLEAESGGVLLSGQRSYPIFESTTAAEIFFMTLWAFVLAWPLWNRIVNRVFLRGRRDAIRRWRARKLAFVFGVSLVAMLAWKLTVDGEMTFNTASYKEELTKGAIVPTRVVFPPLALGFAETHVDETYRPPTWTPNSEITEEGYYARGPRVPKEADRMGFTQAANPVQVRFAEPARNAATRHLMGTDTLGRDLLVRALYGGRVSLSVGLVSTAILMLIGVVLGSLAGYFGGGVDLFISRLIEVVICFPVFFLILVVVSFVGPSIINIMVVIGLLRWTGVARLARAELMRLKEMDFVVAARALGLSTPRTVFRHMLPNALGPLLVAGSFSVAAGILIESGLSFLGFGINLPIPSWGSLVNETRNLEYWWIQVFPGLLIFLTVLCYNLVGDAVRDAMDPKMKV